MENYRLLGIITILLFGFNSVYYALFVNIPDIFNICYLTLLFLGFGLFTENRLLYGIGTFFSLFAAFQLFGRILGLVSFWPLLFSFWLATEMIIHTYIIIITVIGFKKFGFFDPRTWWIASIVGIIIWISSFAFTTTGINVNYTLTAPPLLDFLGVWGFFGVMSIIMPITWYFINRRFLLPSKG